MPRHSHLACTLFFGLFLLIATSVQAQTVGTIRFLESFPEETDLDSQDLDQAWQQWPEILAGARSSIDVASFYYSRQGDGKDAAAPAGIGDRLRPALAALPAAGLRGCQVRVLGDSKFQKTYPEALAWLDAQPGVTTRAIDCPAHWGGGVMHAKYFVVDDRTLYIGSQNWDWRAMNQIRELGALVSHPDLATRLRSIFDWDWALAGQAEGSGQLDPAPDPASAPAWSSLNPALLKTAGGETCQAVLAASPAGALPEDVPWDLPLLLDAIGAAETRIRVQLLSYGVTDRDNNFWPVLDNALRAAGARKVQVQIIVSNWAKAGYSAPWLKSLASVPNIEVKFSNIPEHSAGFIPFARVEHPKYLTVDGQTAWIGTSNWSRDYFYQSRNVSLFLRGEGAVSQLDAFFEAGWDGPYTETVDPCTSYRAPKRN